LAHVNSGLIPIGRYDKRIQFFTNIESGAVMKPKARMLFLIVSLMLPYMGFVMYRALTHPQHPFPSWFLYIGPCYFIGSIVLVTVLRKRIIAGAQPLRAEVQRVQTVSAARAARRLGYIWLVGPVFYILNGGLSREPVWITVLGLSWVGFLSWASFRVARNIDLKTRQNPV
jgi:hypothetical protein